MNARRRTADGRYAREVQPGSGDTLAAATVAAGLVIGAAEHLSPAVAAAQQARHADPERTSMGGNHDAPPPSHPLLPAAASATTDLGTSTVAEAPVSDFPEPVGKGAVLDTAAHALGVLPETVPDGSQGTPSPDTAASSSPPAAEAVQASLSSAAQSISGAMKTLIDHVEGLKAEMPGLSGLQHQFDGLAEDAGRLAQGIASATGAALQPIDLSELLGGPALQALPATADLVTQQLPATLLGAEGPVGIALGNVDSPSVAHDVVQAVPEIAGIDLPQDVSMIVADVAPLQLGFLGQSYTDSGDAHDFGSHGLVSPLHGFI